MSVVATAKRVIEVEVLGLKHIATNMGHDFEEAVRLILSTKGRTIICGMGKSGIIGKKIAASFASTGTPSFFMHPGEAFHGDLGMVKPEDVFIAISNSGETDEVLKLLPFLRDNGNHVIAVTGNCNSTLARNAHCHLNVQVPSEACPHQLAPTASTTATLVMGDALTVALMEERDFKPENFARFHPGGSLGRKLLAKACDEMDRNVPHISGNADFKSVVSHISKGGLGLVLVSLEADWGIITDGDIRRAMEREGKDVFDLFAKDIASINPYFIEPCASIQSSYEMMNDKGVTSLIVKTGDNILGVLKK